MPANATVFIHYGPYDACGQVDYRDSRLVGLQSMYQNKNEMYFFKS